MPFINHSEVKFSPPKKFLSLSSTIKLILWLKRSSFFVESGLYVDRTECTGFVCWWPFYFHQGKHQVLDFFGQGGFLFVAHIVASKQLVEWAPWPEKCVGLSPVPSPWNPWSFWIMKSSWQVLPVVQLDQIRSPTALVLFGGAKPTQFVLWESLFVFHWDTLWALRPFTAVLQDCFGPHHSYVPLTRLSALSSTRHCHSGAHCCCSL